MLFIEVGREVTTRNLKTRNNKAVIKDIIDNTFVVIMKQDKSNEVVTVKDLVLNDRVYSLEELSDDSCSFYKQEELKSTNDFERFVNSLESRVTNEILCKKFK